MNRLVGCARKSATHISAVAAARYRSCDICVKKRREKRAGATKLRKKRRRKTGEAARATSVVCKKKDARRSSSLPPTRRRRGRRDKGSQETRVESERGRERERRGVERKEPARGKARGLLLLLLLGDGGGKPRACEVIRAVEALSLFLPFPHADTFPPCSGRRAFSYTRPTTLDPYSFCMKSPRQIHAGDTQK